jgi:hypothetical protein
VDAEYLETLVIKHMRHLMSLFLTATGEWHVSSILAFASWFVGVCVTGGFMFATLKVNRDDRVREFQKVQQSLAQGGDIPSRR